MKDNLFKITKTKLLDSGFNVMEGHFWNYLYYFRIYNQNKTKYCRYAFVISFTGEDFDEFRYDEENDNYMNCYTPKDYADELANSFIYSYDFSYDAHKEFFEDCKESINRYNKRIAPDYDTSTIWGMACELTREILGEADKRLSIC